MKSIQTIPNAVRLFPFHLKKGGEFRDKNNHFHFAEVVLAQKTDDAINAGQLTPLGGKCNKDELPLQALVRETIEETSCKHVSLMRIQPVIQHYTFYHSKQKRTLERSALFAAGEILAQHENLCPQNALEDKLIIRTLDSEQFLRLLSGKTLQIAGRQCSILDSLHPDSQNRERHGTESSDREVLAVQRFLLQALAIYEAAIKKRILSVLMEKLWSHYEATTHCRHFSEEHDRLLKLKTEKPQETEAFFDSFVHQHHVPSKDLILSYSQLEKMY